MNNTTDTNQASEDELQRYHLSGCAKYETLRGIYPNDRRLTGGPCSCGIESLIRTEKLKLLAELEEHSEVMNSDVVPIYGVPMSVIYTLINKLEAEL